MKKSKMLFPLLVLSFALTACGTTTSLTQTSNEETTTVETTSDETTSDEITSEEITSEEESSETTSTSEIVDVDTFDVIDAGLTAEDGKAYFNISGHYNIALTVNNPKIYVRNGDDGESTFSQSITCDSTTGLYSAKVDLTDMTNGSWHDIKIFLDEDGEATGEVQKSTLPDGVYDESITIDYPGIDNMTKTFSFAEWDDNLKIYVECVDLLETSFEDMQFVVADDKVYFQLTGINSHENGKLILKDGDTSYEFADTGSEFVYDDEFNFVATVDVTDILKDGGKFDIKFSFTDSAGTTQEFEATNSTLLTEPDMNGVSLDGVNYVFRVDTWEDNRYYKIASNTDGFCVDTIQLSVNEGSVNLHLQGVINTTASTDNLNITLSGTDLSLVDADQVLSTNNYYIADFDVTDVPLYSDITVCDDQGAVKVRNGTDDLNSIWTGDWSHRNDITEVSTESFNYLLEGVLWGQLALKKTSII
jgi:hypothetical protein